jgi:hypothetical protein
MKAGIYTISRCAMKVKTYMHSMFMCQLREPDYFFRLSFIDMINLFPGDVAGSVKFEIKWISYRDPDKIKSPAIHPFKIFFG